MSINDIASKLTFLCGSAKMLEETRGVVPRVTFDYKIIDFLFDLSKKLMEDKESRRYSDVVTFAFWIRKASLTQLKKDYIQNDGNYHLGKGLVFHIAPSNVPVNFAYSLVSGLLAGNANIVRVPSKEFEQIEIIARSINQCLEQHKDMRTYVFLVRYERDKAVNDCFSAMADIRIIWGGNQTIADIRQSPLPPRSTEITFADRYSLAVVDSDVYMTISDKERVAEDFYNDTYFSDQNACTSPTVVIWTGKRREKAKEIFWSELHALVKTKYGFQDIQGVNKLTSTYLAASHFKGIKIQPTEDNLITRVCVDELPASLMEYMDNSGFFFEYDCNDILELREICDDRRCQTIGYIGNRDMFDVLFDEGIKGVDRIVPLGHTMDFDLIWDGYGLISQMSRVVTKR